VWCDSLCSWVNGPVVVVVFFWRSVRDHIQPAASISQITECYFGSLDRKVMGSSSSKWWLCASSNTGHSVIKCTSVFSAWPHHWHVAGSGWFWFLVILLQYHTNSGVCPPVRRCESRVLCEGVKSFSWSLFTYVAWGTAGLAILLHLRAQWWRITVLAVLKSTGAAVCGNVEASFAILSAHMFPSIPQWPGILWNVVFALPPAAICSTSESTWCTIFSFPVAFASFWIADLESVYRLMLASLGTRFFLKLTTFCNATLIATISARYIQGGPKKQHKVYGTIILQPYITEPCDFQQNVRKEILKKVSVWIQQLSIFCLPLASELLKNRITFNVPWSIKNLPLLFFQ